MDARIQRMEFSSMLMRKSVSPVPECDKIHKQDVFFSF
jgi:hypothetical protein